MAGFQGEYQPSGKYGQGDYVYWRSHQLPQSRWRRILVWLRILKPLYGGGGFYRLMQVESADGTRWSWELLEER